MLVLPFNQLDRLAACRDFPVEVDRQRE